MWPCPKCGERIDDVFDACWKCGTARDGTPAADFKPEPRYSDVIDPTSEPEPPDETAENAAATAGHIVELCSAANVAEAYAVRIVLEEEGIRAEVVGDFLSVAAGSLPLGETVAPRVWVREEDVARAREILDQHAGRSSQALNVFAADDERGEADAALEEASPAVASAARLGWLGGVLLVLGLSCLLVEAVWAWQNWRVSRECSAVAEGMLVGYEWHYSYRVPPPPETPLPREPVELSTWYDAQYAFVVDGEIHYATVRVPEQLLDRMPIHYDPRRPATYFVGSLTPPRLILAWALGIGGPLLLVGCYLYMNRRRSVGSVEPSESDQT